MNLDHTRLGEDDVVQQLRYQHEEIRRLFDDLLERAPADRPAGFAELRAYLVAHETAERIVLRPVVEEVLDPEVAERRTYDAESILRMLRGLELLEDDAGAFADGVLGLWSAVEAHLAAEEDGELLEVLSAVPHARRTALGAAVAVVDEAVRTTLAQQGAGRGGSPVDAAARTTRDLLSRGPGQQVDDVDY